MQFHRNVSLLKELKNGWTKGAINISLLRERKHELFESMSSLMSESRSLIGLRGTA